MSVSKLASMITGMEGAKLEKTGEEYTYRYFQNVLKELDEAVGYTAGGGRCEIEKPQDTETYTKVGKLISEPKYDVPTGVVSICVTDGSDENLIAEVKLFPAGKIKSVEEYNYDDHCTDFFRIYSDENGAIKKEVPEGNYLLVVGKGSEYSIHRSLIEVNAGKECKVKVTLDRIIDLTADGWYVGDLHHHSVYSSPLYPPQGTDYVYDTPHIVAMSMQAMGLTFGALSDHHNVLNHREWEKEKNDHFLPIISKEISTTNGHVLSLNVDDDVIYRIPEEKDRTDEYLRNEFIRTTDEIKKKGGHPQINHPRDMQKAISFNPDFTDIIDIFDTMEIWNGSHPLMDGTTNYEAFMYWVSLLEEGKFIAATTGSDTHEVGLHFWQDSFGYIEGLRQAIEKKKDSLNVELKKKAEYVLSLLESQWPMVMKWEKENLTSGCVRTYVYAPGKNGDHFASRTPENLLEQLHLGHSFVTNGPILIARINGKLMGETAGFEVDAENITAKLTIVSNKPLKTLEIWQNGGRKEILPLPEVSIENGCYDYSGEVKISLSNAKWVFFRTMGDYTAEAVTNPIFLKAE